MSSHVHVDPGARRGWKRIQDFLELDILAASCEPPAVPVLGTTLGFSIGVYALPSYLSRYSSP